jgi:CheY-like chemotaxis protein
MIWEDPVENTILVIDEDVNARIVAETLLRARGLHVIGVADAVEACDILCCEGAAVVVLGLLPGMRGIDILRRLRGRFTTQTFRTEPRIVVVADWPEPAVERLAFALGADAFLSKPFTPGEFLTTIEQPGAAPRRPSGCAASGF